MALVSQQSDEQCWAGLCNIMKGTHSDPSQSGSRIINIFDYAKDMLVEFCRESKVPAASM